MSNNMQDKEERYSIAIIITGIAIVWCLIEVTYRILT